jgi:hypothetical protein
LTLQDLFSVTPTLQTNDKKLKKTGIAPVTLPAPLPLRHQEKINREAAYDETKSATTKQWGETMKHIREAEFLSFPLQKSNDGQLDVSAPVFYSLIYHSKQTKSYLIYLLRHISNPRTHLSLVLQVCSRKPALLVTVI